jgi:hypothetical protein
LKADLTYIIVRESGSNIHNCGGQVSEKI